MICVDGVMRMASLLQQKGHLVQAETLLNRLLESHPLHAHALHLLGIIAYQRNNIKLAINLIEQAIKSQPNIGLFHSNLGEMYRKLNAISLSIQCGQRAVELAPNSASALSNLGIAYYDAKQYEEAHECHQQALAIYPELSASINNMGSIYKAYGQIKQAIEFYQKAIALSPQFVEPWNNLGALFNQQQEFSQALTYLSHAIQLAPSFADAHCNIGFTFVGLDQCDQALIHFKIAVPLKSNYAEAYYGIAKVYLHQQHFTQSEAAINHAIMINPQQVEFYQLLAAIHQEQGHYKQALMYLETALQIDSSCNAVYLSKGTVLMEMGELDKSEEQFLQSTTNQDIDSQVLAHYSLVQLRKVKSDHESLNKLLTMAHLPTNKLEYVNFALGKCYDDMGEWAKAFEYFTLGNQIKRSRIIYNMTEQIEFTNKLIHCFTSQAIEYFQTFAHPSTLPIFIVGMPRSGTTLVEQIVSNHMHVFGAGELKYLAQLIQKPIQHYQKMLYYPENIQQYSPEIWHAITNDYLTYIQRFAPNAPHITDKMPYNFTAIGLIHALFPNAKIIHVERNPMDTCLSCFTQLFTQGQLYSYDLTELGQYYQCYERTMNHWRHILPPNAWLDIKYENLVQHFDDEAKRLIDFCELPWDPACLRFYQSKRQVRTASFAQVRQPVYMSSVERWRRYEKELAPLLKAL